MRQLCELRVSKTLNDEECFRVIDQNRLVHVGALCLVCGVFTLTSKLLLFLPTVFAVISNDLTDKPNKFPPLASFTNFYTEFTKDKDSTIHNGEVL